MRGSDLLHTQLRNPALIFSKEMGLSLVMDSCSHVICKEHIYLQIQNVPLEI